METLIINSARILSEDDNIQVVYGWMDLGDVICEKTRSDIPLKEEEFLLLRKLTTMCKRIKLDTHITLYRGTAEKFDPIVAGKQFNAMSPDINTAKTYGPYLTKIIVPMNSNAFYISAWQIINTEIETQDEKEVVLLPGRFILSRKKEEEEIITYLYDQGLV